jgi:hypothetical protein
MLDELPENEVLKFIFYFYVFILTAVLAGCYCFIRDLGRISFNCVTYVLFL